MSEIRVLGIDLGKDICSVVGMDVAGKALLRRRMRRDTVLKLAAGIPHASWRWKCVAALIIWAASFASRATMSG